MVWKASWKPWPGVVPAAGHLRAVRHGVGELGPRGAGAGRRERRDVDQEVAGQGGEVGRLEVGAHMQDHVGVAVRGAAGVPLPGVLADDEEVEWPRDVVPGRRGRARGRGGSGAVVVVGGGRRRTEEIGLRDRVVDPVGDQPDRDEHAGRQHGHGGNARQRNQTASSASPYSSIDARSLAMHNRIRRPGSMGLVRYGVPRDFREAARSRGMLWRARQDSNLRPTA